MTVDRDGGIELRVSLCAISNPAQRRSPTYKGVGFFKGQPVSLEDRDCALEVLFEGASQSCRQSSFRAMDQTLPATPVFALRNDLPAYFQMRLSSVGPACDDFEGRRERANARLQPIVARLVQLHCFFENFQSLLWIAQQIERAGQ